MSRLVLSPSQTTQAKGPKPNDQAKQPSRTTRRNDAVNRPAWINTEETVAHVTPGDSASPTGPQAAAAYMCELLLRPGRYRRKWEQYAERSRLGQVNQLAVAEVLAHYLWEHPRATGDTDVLPRQLKDTASRALSGRLLSK